MTVKKDDGPYKYWDCDSIWQLIRHFGLVSWFIRSVR